MKKVFAKTLAFLALFGMISGSAMAADPIDVYKDDDTITVKVSTLEESEETSLLVTKGTATIAEAFADTTKVYHIDQVAADKDGVSTFSFTYSGTDPLTVYSGYATMAATDDPYWTVVDESTPPTPGASYTLGDVNNDGNIDTSDAGAIVQHFINDAQFLVFGSATEVYEYGLQAADITGDGIADTSDAGKVVAFFINGSPLQ